ncbi:MAG: DUF5615 family PIN-like protein [bacterium]
MSLFIKLYLDEDVSVSLADLSRARGVDVLTGPEARTLSADDDAQMAFATKEERTLLSLNRHDFDRLFNEYLVAGKKHYGIIMARRRSEYEILRRLLTILNYGTANEMENEIRYI